MHVVSFAQSNIVNTMGHIFSMCLTFKSTAQNYGSTPSSVLSSLSSLRSRPYTGLGVSQYSPTPDVNEVYPGLFVGDA